MGLCFLLPGTLLMKSGGRPAKGNTVDAGNVELHSCQTLTPETETSTHYFFQQGHRTGQGDSELAASMFQMLIRAFDEDKDMIGAQSASLALAPDFKMFPLHLDGALMRFRRLVEAEMTRDAVPSVLEQPSRAKTSSGEPSRGLEPMIGGPQQAQAMYAEEFPVITKRLRDLGIEPS